jgi:kynurenine formamidase
MFREENAPETGARAGFPQLLRRYIWRRTTMNDIYIQGTTVIDLSQAIEPGIPVPAGFPAPQIEVYLSQERGDVANAELLTMSVHAGTHVDAPYHFFSSLRTVDELAPGCLIGPAVVVDMTAKRGSAAIEAEDLR